MIPPPTANSRQRARAPDSIDAALAVVPPMSKEITSLSPSVAATARAPTAPPAGPDSTTRHGCAAAAASVVSPPFDCMSSSGAATPAESRSRRRSASQARIFGMT